MRELHLVRVLGPDAAAAVAAQLGLVVVARAVARVGPVGQAVPVALAGLDTGEADPLVRRVAEHLARRVVAHGQAAERDEGLLAGAPSSSSAAARAGALPGRPELVGALATAAELPKGRRGRGDAPDGALEIGQEDDIAGPVVQVVRRGPVVLDVRRSDHGRDRCAALKMLVSKYNIILSCGRGQCPWDWWPREGWLTTYMDPKDRRRHIKIFWRKRIIVPQTMKPGKTARDKSVMMVEAVDVYERATKVDEPAHSPSPVQLAETGRHRSSTPTRVTSMVAMVRPSSVKTATLYFVLA